MATYYVFATLVTGCHQPKSFSFGLCTNMTRMWTRTFFVHSPTCSFPNDVILLPSSLESWSKPHCITTF